MMQTCDFCSEWAQWRAALGEQRTTLLCGQHRQDLIEKNAEMVSSGAIKLAFVGAVPMKASN